MNRMDPMFQDLPFCCTKKVPKNHNKLFHFRHGGGIHFLVLAQTLMQGTDPITQGYPPAHTTKHDSQNLNIFSKRNI